MGYRRENGTVGVRNYVAIIPSVFCANTTVQRIAEKVEGAVALRHPLGCAQVGYDLELTVRTLVAMGSHPNVAAVLVVGLGCERCKPEEVYEGIKRTGKPVEMLVVQDDGGMTETIKKGIEIAGEMAEAAKKLQRVEVPISELMIGTKCGGTDATSGLAANPVVGNMCDRLIAEGGSAILSELNELLGTEDILARRAATPEVGEKIKAAVYEIEEELKNRCDLRYPERNNLISPGNFAGGVSSVVEKALGGVHKSGTSKFVDVLDYALPSEDGKKGLFLMKYESHDGEVVTGMIGCGAQIVAFTTGRGNPTGFPFVPVVKVTGNKFTYEKMKESFDFDASPIISDGVAIEELGEELLTEIIEIASGKETTAELFGADDLFCIARRF